LTLLLQLGDLGLKRGDALLLSARGIFCGFVGLLRDRANGPTASARSFTSHASRCRPI
jgi:hypothetical protein